MTLDELRNDNPELAFALYALEPGGPVTFEVITPDEQVFTFKGPTAQAAIDSAFPPREPETSAPPPPADSIFD